MCDDLVVASYTAAREEVLTRISIRTRVLGFYLVAVGTVLSLTTNDSRGDLNAENLMLYVSWFAFAVSLIVAHQNIAIAAVYDFINQNLADSFPTKDVIWSGSQTDDALIKTRRGFRILSQLAITYTPVVLISWIAAMQDGSGMLTFMMSGNSGTWLASFSILLVYLFSFHVRSSVHNVK